MTLPLTERQEQLWRYIKGCTRSPSFTEMRDALGFESKSSVHRLITALEERGYIMRISNRARTIVALEPALPAPASEVRYIPFRGRIA